MWYVMGISRDICIASHSLVWFPSPLDWVLDVGSRNYSFSSQLVQYGCNIVAVEPDLSVPKPSSERIHLCSVALVPESQNGTNQQLICWSTGEGNHLVSVPGDIPVSHNKQEVIGKSVSQISKDFGVDRWSIVKLDCEGSEYGILQEWPGPIAEQITVEFHEHCSANPQGEITYEKIFKHLYQWYKVIKHEKTILNPKLCNIPNYWDSLFVLK